jgi:hypothetical protein
MLIRDCHKKSVERSCSVISSREEEKFIVYYGFSMSSTFQDLDVLCYIPKKKIRPGDVVVINMPKNGHKIIHRVISVREQGIRTAGDCNPYPDRWFLSPDQIMGSISYGYRGRKRFRVLGGLAGLVHMFQIRFKNRTIKLVNPVLKIIYYNFPLSRLMKYLIRPRLIAFKRPEGTELQLLVLGKVIGRRFQGQEWQIQPPFGLFLHESILPD